VAYPPEPQCAAILRLLGSVWPNVLAAIERAGRWGADWCRASTPFVSWGEDGEALGHVGVVPVHLRAAGRDLSVAGIHAVCTSPSHRRRGHLRRAMRLALPFVDARYDTAVLWTDEPDIYRRYGFEVRTEHLFRGEIAPGPRRKVDRPLDPDRPADLSRLRELLATRTPVAELCAAGGPGWHFLIALSMRIGQAGGDLVRELPDLGCAVVSRLRGRALVLEDVIGPTIPPLGALVERLAGGAEEVEVLFTPDRLGAHHLGQLPRPPPETLMVRGRPLPEGPLALSPMAQT